MFKIISTFIGQILKLFFMHVLKDVLLLTIAHKKLDLPQVLLKWVLIGSIQFIMRSVLNLKWRTSKTCKTRHSLISPDRILSGDAIHNKLAGGE